MVPKKAGEKWIQSFKVPEEIGRQFAAVCASNGFPQGLVLTCLVGLYAEGKIDLSKLVKKFRLDSRKGNQ